MTHEQYQEMKKAFWAKFEAFEGENPDACDYALRGYYVDLDEDPDEGVRNTYEKGKITQEAYAFASAYIEVEKEIKRIAARFRNTKGHDGAACALHDCKGFLD